jgi:hypothetical protein
MNPYISNIDKFYKDYINPEYVNLGWAIVNTKQYRQYKNSKITSARITSKTIPIVDFDGTKLNNTQSIVYCESKYDYRILKYNSNFLAIKIAEREYDLVKDVEIWAIKKGNKNDYNLKLDKNPPEFKFILNVLNWKMTKKSYDNIEVF